MALGILVKAGAMHPDLALLTQTQRRAICCLVLDDEKTERLEALCALQPFHAYAQAGKVALLFGDTDGAAWLRRAQALLEKNGLCAGMSGPFALAASAHGCMAKARIALETGRIVAPGRALYPMDEFGEAALLRAAAFALGDQDFAAEDFCDAALGDMARVDAEEGTQYGPSLRAYLANGLNLRLAAQQLGVHRNTLDYRLRRMNARFALDLSSRNTCFELMFSLWLKDGLPSSAQEEPPAAFDGRAARTALWRYIERTGDEENAAGDENFRVALLCVDVGRLADDRREALILALCALPDGCVCAYDEDMLCFALPPDAAKDFLSGCTPLCAEQGCPVVLTQPFSSRRMGRRLRLCRYALKACAGPVTRVQDIGSTLFFMALERRISLAPYLCEDVVRVMDEDAVRGTALSRSLYAYLLHFGDMKQAAQQLGMHRNTMEYQMRKIHAIIPEHLGPRRRFLMMCTYKMLALPDMGIADL